jgi:transmembrane sensor
VGTRREDFGGDLEAEATEWLVRLDGGRTPELLADHGAWLSQSARHQIAYARQALAWKRMDALRRLRPLDRGKDADPDLLRPRGRWLGFNSILMAFKGAGWLPKAATAVAATALLAVGAVVALQANSEVSYATQVGGVQKLMLEDGTSVSLNTDTEIRVRFTAARREILLDHGEILLSVAHDASRPLEVVAGNVTSRAVGTKFAVRLYEGDSGRVETLVTEGRVLVLRQASVLGWSLAPEPLAHTLNAGERVVVDQRSVVVSRVSAREVQRKLMWTTGKIMFDGEKLSNVVRELNRYNARQLVILDPGISDTSVGGGFDTSRADAYAADLMRFFGEKKLSAVESARPR